MEKMEINTGQKGKINRKLNKDENIEFYFSFIWFKNDFKLVGRAQGLIEKS